MEGPKMCIPDGQDAKDDVTYVKDWIEILGQSPDLESNDAKNFIKYL